MSHLLNRRALIESMAAGLGTVSASGWFPAFAQAAAADPNRRRHCILLWMSGGPTQTDTFDMKPNHENGGEFQEVQTAVPGLRFSEHLPKLGQMSDKLAVLRGLSTKEGDHGRGTYLMRTGQKPMGPIQYPCIGSSLAKQLAEDELTLPSNVSIGTYRAFNQDAFSPGFLGPRFGPLFVGAADVPGAVVNDDEGFPNLQVQSLQRAGGITDQRMQQRLKIWRRLQSQFVSTRQAGAAGTHNEVYEGAVQLMNSDDAKAFDLSGEPKKLREAYGANVFGQGCLMARRLIQRGVPFVEVSLGTNSGGVGWDTHSDNFNAVERLSKVLDDGWGTLMRDLEDHGLLESTTILWMGEFGRTPSINSTGGRDHFPNAWTSVLAGGGIAGGQAYGATSADGQAVESGQIGVQDLLSTLCKALGLGGAPSNMSPSGRPIPISEGNVIEDVLA
ncbi:DUF1501 domain-containing protein [Roseiconus nitratireducens]|uniref:DUF1501 domain-containing protein n=1 Tax=Roseiconus nitratireducens TaxID=2605748 RepID=A0A5M6CVM6_9BACT|nr:DUF1501 domain-containing protein [Roseiconus nitratireducens]KAA5538986.1 DUF1501 domain-containing protein [Roseiconus nitratireducens]